MNQNTNPIKCPKYAYVYRGVLKSRKSFRYISINYRKPINSTKRVI
jgi:hypothetical protein